MRVSTHSSDIRTARPGSSLGIARITVDMLGGIPQGRMRADSRVVGPGRRVELVEASPTVGDRVGTPPDWGYGRAIDWRFVEGGYADPGPAALWTRLRIPLVEGETTSPLSRLLVVADSANGLSGELPLAEWLFMDARSTIGPHGRGLAQATLSDAGGLVAPR